VKPLTVAAAIAVTLLSASCRQPDGATPTLDAQSSNRIYDLSRDLGAIAGGDATAQRDLVDDLSVLAEEDDAQAQAVVRAFAERLAAAVGSARLTDQSAQQLAQTSWTVVGVTDLSDRQVRALQGELRMQLASAGIPQDVVDTVVADVPTVQRAVTTRPRRWYEVL
jgi:predicted NBD/HSP70 family sugar kinase